VTHSILVISAHPDDAELACSGTVKKLTNEGHAVYFVDCTRGELGSRGTPETRAKEACDAAETLGVKERVILDMHDGSIEQTNENVTTLARYIRLFKPSVVLIPPPSERHPDHEAVHKLARSAVFMAGLSNVETVHNGSALPTHRTKAMYCYQLHYDFPRAADFYVDVSETYADRIAAIRAFATQFHVPNADAGNEPATFISTQHFFDQLDARCRYYGGRIGTAHAEAFLSVEPIGLTSLSQLL
jgi:bacillithiol biosynthesis deacetylase BshB1